MPRELLELDKLRQGKEGALANIPAFPPVVLRILDLLSSEDTDLGELTGAITSDATLSAQVLRVANSALFGFACEIDTVQHAVTALGLDRVQSLVMTVATSNYMRAAFRTEALARCWRHTLASAVICKELARAAGIPADRAYSFGLLHDIGRLGLLVRFPDTYNQILADADRDSVSLLDLEKKRFGMDHCEAGSMLVERWNLPHEFCVTAGRHHDRPEGGPMDTLRFVHVACQMSDTLGYSVVVPLKPASFEELREMLPQRAKERFPADPELLRATVETALGEDIPAPGSGTARGPLLPEAPKKPQVMTHDGEPLFPRTFHQEDSVDQIARDLSVILITLALVTLLAVGVAYFWKS